MGISEIIIAFVVVAIIILIVLSFFPLKKCMVDDRYVYGVRDMREKYPRANYVGQSWKSDIGKIEVFAVKSCQEKDLNFWQWLKAKRYGGLCL